MSRRTINLALLSLGLPILVGCMPKMTIDDMKAAMPQRPGELDRLNAFTGKWVAEGTATMAGLAESLDAKGKNEAKWEGDGWYLVNRGSFSMGELGKIQAIETWTYDTYSKKYRNTWVDSMGSTGMGESRYDEKSKMWHFKATSYGPFGKSTMKGTAEFPDDATMKWTWTESNGLTKTMEMTGTSRRK